MIRLKRNDIDPIVLGLGLASGLLTEVDGSTVEVRVHEEFFEDPIAHVKKIGEASDATKQRKQFFRLLMTLFGSASSETVEARAEGENREWYRISEGLYLVSAGTEDIFGLGIYKHWSSGEIRVSTVGYVPLIGITADGLEPLLLKHPAELSIQVAGTSEGKRFGADEFRFKGIRIDAKLAGTTPGAEITILDLKRPNSSARDYSLREFQKQPKELAQLILSLLPLDSPTRSADSANTVKGLFALLWLDRRHATTELGQAGRGSSS